MTITLTRLALDNRAILEALDQGEAPATLDTFAKQLQRDPSNVRKSLKALAVEGLILGQTAPGQAQATLTDAGRQMLAGMLVAEGRLSAALPALTRDQIEPDPDQPRKQFDQGELEELAESIADRGLLEPILIRLLDDGSARLVAGERRWRAIGLLIAAEDARWPADRAVPYHLSIQTDDAEILADQVVENLQRARLHPLEEAEAFRTLKTVHGWGVGRIAKTASKTRRFVEQRLDLLNLTPVQQGRMRLAKDHPDHLTTARAREMVQHLRQIAGAGQDQRDIEEIAPGPDVAAVSAEDEAAARKPKLTPREMLILGEIAAAAVASPSTLFPYASAPVADIDWEKARGWQALQGLVVKRFVATMRDSEQEGAPAGAYVEDLGHIRLRLESLHPADNPRALFHLRREAGISADQARQLQKLGQWSTPFLNLPAAESPPAASDPDTGGTVTRPTATPTSSPALPDDYLSRWSLPFAGAAGRDAYGSHAGSDWHSPAERLILLELADKCLTEPAIVGGEHGWTAISVAPPASELGGLHGGIVTLGSIRRLYTNVLTPAAKLHFSAGTATESGGIHGALTRLGFYSDRQAALEKARLEAGFSQDDLKTLAEGELYATPWLNTVAATPQAEPQRTGQVLECPIVAPAWRLPWITIVELQDAAGNIGYRAITRLLAAQTIDATEFLPNQPLALTRKAESLQGHLRDVVPVEVMDWLDQLQGEHVVDGVDRYNAIRAAEARADRKAKAVELTAAEILILRELGHALDLAEGQAVPVGAYWLDHSAVGLWKRSPAALVEFKAAPGQGWTAELTEAGRAQLQVLAEDFDPLSLELRIEREGRFASAWLNPQEATPIGDQLGEDPDADEAAEESDLLNEVRAELAAGAPDPGKLLQLVGLVGEFVADDLAFVRLEPTSGSITDVAAVDPHRLEPEDLACARAELIAFALNAFARSAAQIPAKEAA